MKSMAVLAVLVCFSATAAEAAIPKRKPLPAALQALFSAVDDNCAGNDNGALLTFKPAQFNARRVMTAIRIHDTDAMGVDCAVDHVYSRSKAQAVQNFVRLVTTRGTDEQVCLAQNLKPEQFQSLLQLVMDPTNLGVFSSMFDHTIENSNPEGCDYNEFTIFRRDGTLIKFVFNHTD